MNDIVFVFLSVLIAGFLFLRVDWHLLLRGIVPIGTLVFSIYTLTYGFGWLLWRIDPDSLFGYSTKSTLSALHGMGVSFSLGLLILSLTYYLIRSFVLPRPNLDFSLASIYQLNQYRLVPFAFIILLFSAALFPYLSLAGMFTRGESISIHGKSVSAVIVTLSKGFSLLSRLVPVALLLLPVAFKKISQFQRVLLITALSTFVYIAFLTGSRTLLFTVPVYLFIGFVFWFHPSPARLILITFLCVVLAIPISEQIRVQREGDPSVQDLRVKYQLFQIGKQLIGTSHDFYLYVDPESCRSDLADLMNTDDLAREIILKGVTSYPPESFQRWHISGRLSACAHRQRGLRRWTGFQNFPAGLLPKTLGFSTPSLFDGQELSHELARSLDLKPGEISNSTLSLFADSWWRFRWSGVIIAFVTLGIILALFQSFIDYQVSHGAVVGLLSQLLLFTLIGSWINNTALTTIWILLWELPKTLLISYFALLVVGLMNSYDRTA